MSEKFNIAGPNKLQAGAVRIADSLKRRSWFSLTRSRVLLSQATELSNSSKIEKLNETLKELKVVAEKARQSGNEKRLSKAYSLMVKAYWEIGGHYEAAREYHTASAAYVHVAHIAWTKAALFGKIGDEQGKRHALILSAEGYRKDAEMHTKIADRHEGMRDYQKAIRRLERAIHSHNDEAMRRDEAGDTAGATAARENSKRARNSIVALVLL